MWHDCDLDVAVSSDYFHKDFVIKSETEGGPIALKC